MQKNNMSFLKILQQLQMRELPELPAGIRVEETKITGW